MTPASSFICPTPPQGHETLAQIQTDLARLQQDCDINLGELTVEIGYKEQEEWKLPGRNTIIRLKSVTG